MSATPEITIVIPCYNHGQFLGEAVDSILSQTFQNWECIIINNGSEDDTATVAEKYASADKRIRVITTVNNGVSAARNAGINAGSGRFIFPLDADDKIHSNYLNEAYIKLNSDPSLKVVYCNAELFGEVNEKWELPSFSIKQMLMENCIFCAALFRRDDFDRSGGYSEVMKTGFEDWDFWLRILKNDNDVYRLSGSYFYYRIRSISRNNSLDEKRQKELRKQLYINHKELYDAYYSVPELLYELNLAKHSLNHVQDQLELFQAKHHVSLKRKIKSILFPWKK